MSDSEALIAMLRSKAVLLLRREGEVFQLRQERSRIERWLNVFRELSLDLHARKSQSLIRDWGAAMVGNLNFQVAAAYECDPARERLRLVSGQAHVPLAGELQLDRATQDLLFEQRSGRHRKGEDEQPSDLAQTLDLAMFFWQALRTRRHRLLFVAGFARSDKFFSLNEYDFSHFVLVGKHVAALLENIALIEELDRERSELSVSNAQLDNSFQSLRETQNKLVQSSQIIAEVSRQAGMAEIATGVLHNVGNVLNSVNVSAEVAAERLRGLKIGSLDRVADLLGDRVDVGERALADRCSKASVYLRGLGAHLAGEVREIAGELRGLQQNIDHIKSIVGKQQAYARTALGISELCVIADLMDDAVGLAEASLSRLGIEIVRDYADLPRFLLERHKVLQILVNLISNAKNALSESSNPEKRITLSVTRPVPDRVRMSVRDNGAGVAPEHLSRLFTHGFTTRKNGHGFGLHTSALSAREMGGALTASSDGCGAGATFVLELPARIAETRESVR